MFDIRRRINRHTFALGVILSIVSLLLVVVALAFLNLLLGGKDSPHPVPIILLIIFFILFWVYTVLLVKQRCNDISGNHAVLLTFLFLFGGATIVLAALPSEKQANQYGKTPKGVTLF